MLTAEGLRRDALAALAAGEADAEEVLGVAEVVLELEALRWEASAGTTVGHRVALGVEAALLGRVHGRPPVLAAITAALAVAIARRPRESLADVRLFWAPWAHPRAEGYRDAPPAPRAARAAPTPGDVLHAATAFLRAHDDERAAAVASRATLALDEPASASATLRVAAADAGALAAVAPALAAALRVLLAGPDGRDLRVRVRSSS